MTDVPNIALRAYQLWDAAGRPEGKSDEFYFAAEEEFRLLIESGRRPVRDIRLDTMTKSKHSKIFPETLEKRVADLSVGRLRPVLYFGKQFGLHPNALVRDPLTVRLSFPDQRREPSAKIGGRVFVESMVDLAGIDEIISLAAAEIDALSIIAIKCKASDGERLALRAGRPDPGPRSSGKTGAVAHLRDNALKPNLAGVRKHFPAIECRSFR